MIGPASAETRSVKVRPMVMHSSGVVRISVTVALWT
jgi:hypothetical protein